MEQQILLLTLICLVGATNPPANSSCSRQVVYNVATLQQVYKKFMLNYLHNPVHNIVSDSFLSASLVLFTYDCNLI